MLAPSPARVFFEQAVLKGEVGHNLLERQCLGAQVLDLATGCLSGSVAGQALLAGLEEFLRPAVIQALGDPFATAQLRNAVLAPKPCQDNPDCTAARF